MAGILDHLHSRVPHRGGQPRPVRERLEFVVRSPNNEGRNVEALHFFHARGKLFGPESSCRSEISSTSLDAAKRHFVGVYEIRRHSLSVDHSALKSFGKTFDQIELGSAQDAVPDGILQPGDTGFRKRLIGDSVDENQLLDPGVLEGEQLSYAAPNVVSN